MKKKKPMPCYKYNLDTMAIDDKKELKRFEYRTLRRLPDKLRELYESLTYREKLFIPYYFQSGSNSEAAILAGFVERHAGVRGCQTFRKVQPLIRWLEDEIVDKLTKRVIRTSIISREAVIEKLAMMFIPDLGDLEDYEEAKKNGYLAAAKEVEVQTKYDENGVAIGSKRVITKIVDQRAVGMAIVDILGYKEPAKSEVSGPGGTPLSAPVINVILNPIAAPKYNGEAIEIPASRVRQIESRN